MKITDQQRKCQASRCQTHVTGYRYRIRALEVLRLCAI